MRRFVVLLFVLLATVFAFLNLGNVTISWEEEVALLSGQVLQLQREVTIGPDEWGRAGRGRLKEQSLAFVENGTRIKWKNDDTWLVRGMPDILEIVEGMPVVVMSVHQWRPCLKYDFPQDGLVAFGFQDGLWKRISLQSVPSAVKVNLLRNTHAIQYQPEYKNRRIDRQTKVKLESNTWGPKQGASLTDSARFYADLEDSCARMRPLPDQQLQEARQRNIDAERSAPTVQAALVSVISEPEAISGKDFAEQKGIWTGVGYLTKSCKDIVEKIEPIREWSGDDKGYRSELVGYQLIIASEPKRKLQIPEISRALMQCVVCDQTTIYAVRQQDKERLILHRFRHNGDLIDAFRVLLPETIKITAGSEWGTLWSVMPNAEGGLTISIADYTSQSGTINRKVSYALQPPSLPR